MPQPCPCGVGASLEQCCGPVIAWQRPAATAAELMRSRYSAFVVGSADYLWRSWHPRTRPAEVTLDPAVTWTGLRIVHTEAGGPEDSTGIVEFIATYSGGRLQERSLFARRAQRWFYLDGEVG